MMHRLVPFVLMGFALSACENSPPPSPPSQSGSDVEIVLAGETIQTFDGGYTVMYATQPESIPLGEIFAIDVQITDAATGEPVGDDVTLFVDGRMPQHRHGMNTTPVVQRVGPGRFHVDGMQFHMAGRWALSFDVTRGGVTERAMAAVTLE